AKIHTNSVNKGLQKLGDQGRRVVVVIGGGEPQQVDGIDLPAVIDHRGGEPADVDAPDQGAAVRGEGLVKTGRRGDPLGGQPAQVVAQQVLLVAAADVDAQRRGDQLVDVVHALAPHHQPPVQQARAAIGQKGDIADT